MDRIDEILFLYEDDVVEMADGGRILLGDGGFVQKQIDEINRLIRDTDLNQSDIAEAVNKKFPKEKPLKNYNVTHYAKKYFGVKTPKYKPGVSVAVF